MSNILTYFRIYRTYCTYRTGIYKDSLKDWTLMQLLNKQIYKFHYETREKRGNDCPQITLDKHNTNINYYTKHVEVNHQHIG